MSKKVSWFPCWDKKMLHMNPVTGDCARGISELWTLGEMQSYALQGCGRVKTIRYANRNRAMFEHLFLYHPTTLWWRIRRKIEREEKKERNASGTLNYRHISETNLACNLCFDLRIH